MYGQRIIHLINVSIFRNATFGTPELSKTKALLEGTAPCKKIAEIIETKLNGFSPVFYGVMAV
jgi:hypothetical protein